MNILTTMRCRDVLLFPRMLYSCGIDSNELCNGVSILDYRIIFFYLYSIIYTLLFIYQIYDERFFSFIWYAYYQRIVSCLEIIKWLEKWKKKWFVYYMYSGAKSFLVSFIINLWDVGMNIEMFLFISIGC